MCVCVCVCVRVCVRVRHLVRVCVCVFEHCEDQLLYKCSAQVPIAQFENWQVSAGQFKNAQIGAEYTTTCTSVQNA